MLAVLTMLAVSVMLAVLAVLVMLAVLAVFTLFHLLTVILNAVSIPFGCYSPISFVRLPAVFRRKSIAAGRGEYPLCLGSWSLYCQLYLKAPPLT